MVTPKFKIGDKVVKEISTKKPYQISIHIVGVIVSVTVINLKWSYIIRAEKGYNKNSGKVLSEWKYENHNENALESELEKVS